MDKEYEKIKSEIENYLDIFFSNEIKKASLISEYSKKAIELLKDYTLRGGKRIRGLLVYYGYRCFNDDNKNIKDIIKIGAAIEIVHSYLLIHDDFIDQDNLRRGDMTIHKNYEKEYKNFNKKEHFGASMAVIMGDMACSLASKIISETQLDDKTKTKIVKRLNNIIYEVCHGEILDVISNYKELKEKEILKIHELKTASYTFEGPLQIGAIISNANEKELRILKRYSMLVGKAFQMQDDILGIYGNEEELGKPIGSDLKEGKITLLIKKTLEKCNNKERTFLKNILKNKKISKNELNKVKNIISETGSLKEIKKLSKKMVFEAKNIIKKTNFKKEGKDFLINIADYVIERKK